MNKRQIKKKLKKMERAAIKWVGNETALTFLKAYNPIYKNRYIIGCDVAEGKDFSTKLF
jgi:hypothetical protein